MPESPTSIYNLIQTGGVIAVGSLFFWMVLTGRLATGAAYVELKTTSKEQLAAQKTDYEKRLADQKAEFERQISDIRKGHEDRCEDYEKRLEKEERQGLEWRNIALRLGMTATKTTSIAETAVTNLVDKKVAVE